MNDINMYSYSLPLDFLNSDIARFHSDKSEPVGLIQLTIPRPHWEAMKCPTHVQFSLRRPEFT